MQMYFLLGVIVIRSVVLNIIESVSCAQYSLMIIFMQKNQDRICCQGLNLSSKILCVFLPFP